MQHRTISSISAADSRTYTISELAREFGVTPRALRFYEDKDMLHPARDRSEERRVGEECRSRGTPYH